MTATPATLGILIAATLATAACTARADDTVTLSGGGKLVGQVVEQSDDTVVLDEKTLGRLELSRSQVAKVKLDDNEPRWHYMLELGLSGAEGNSDSLNLFTAGNANYASDRHRSAVIARYNFGQEDGDLARNDARINANWDRLFPGHPEFVFVQGLAEFDDFQAWTLRFGLFAGPGYNFYNTDRFKLIGRVGGGVVQEFNADETRPEALAQLSLTYKLTDRQTVSITDRFFPSLDNLGESRNVTEAAWEMKIDRDDGLAFKLSIVNEYESMTSDDSEHNDFKYTASVLYGF